LLVDFGDISGFCAGVAVIEVHYIVRVGFATIVAGNGLTFLHESTHFLPLGFSLEPVLFPVFFIASSCCIALLLSAFRRVHMS
jgi:hypothetical protein